jgi:hypothetical protein
VAVPLDGTGSASVAPVMALPVPGVQKPPRQVGKQFWEFLLLSFFPFLYASVGTYFMFTRYELSLKQITWLWRQIFV